MPKYKELDLPATCAPGGAAAHPRAELDEFGRYKTTGTVWRVCPRLLELDPRHGLAHSKWPVHDDKTRPGGGAWRSPTLHKRNADGTRTNPPVFEPNPDYLEDPEGHDANTFLYVPGAQPPTEHPTCQGCGRQLVCSDGDPI